MSNPLQAIVDLSKRVKEFGNVSEFVKGLRLEVEQEGVRSLNKLSRGNGLTDKKVESLKRNSKIVTLRSNASGFDVAVTIDDKNVRKWALIANTGGTIRPKSSKFLAIPFSSGGKYLSSGQYLKDGKNLTIKSFIEERIKKAEKSGKPLLSYSRSGSGRYRVMFGLNEVLDPIAIATLVPEQKVPRSAWADNIVLDMLKFLKNYEPSQKR